LGNYYDKVKGVYMKIFDRLGIGDRTVMAYASGGDFSKGFSHEFNTKCETGEDVMYHDKEKDEYYNKEVASEEIIKNGQSWQVCEVGNIFPLGTKFSEAFDYRYLDKDGKSKLVYMASYGIGSSRVMGVLVELFHDEAGIVWPEAVAPFKVHLIAISGRKNNKAEKAEDIYNKLRDKGVEVFFDDRESASGGEKLTDADLIGIPWRVVVSDKTGKETEVKKRGEEKETMISVERLIDSMKENESNG
jgi:prolyl-tRNA synthetase